MRRPLLILVALAALAAPAQALAHSTLIQASPGFRERLALSPRAVVLRFDQAVQPLPGSIRVYSALSRLERRARRCRRRCLDCRRARTPSAGTRFRATAMSCLVFTPSASG
jgi:methionine-rich copper-binding protein CopC